MFLSSNLMFIKAYLKVLPDDNTLLKYGFSMCLKLAYLGFCCGTNKNCTLIIELAPSCKTK